MFGVSIRIYVVSFLKKINFYSPQIYISTQKPLKDQHFLDIRTICFFTNWCYNFWTAIAAALNYFLLRLKEILWVQKHDWWVGTQKALWGESQNHWPFSLQTLLKVCSSLTKESHTGKKHTMTHVKRHVRFSCKTLLLNGNRPRWSVCASSLLLS